MGGDYDPYLAPMLSHGINVLLFALTGILLYNVLLQIIPKKFSLKTPLGDYGVPFFATLLYVWLTPCHTEAVANIKGRDEVMCMLLSLLSVYAALKYIKTQKIVHLVWGMFIYFIALLSKENAITIYVPLSRLPISFSLNRKHVITFSHKLYT